jgi:site-specific DNA recombinase
MGPSHAAKGGRRWRYYVSRALLKGRKQDAGSITRVPAAEIEKQVLAAVRSAGSFHDRPIKMSTAASVVALSAEGKLIEPRLDGANYDRLHDAIERVTVRKREIEIRLNDTLVADGQSRTLFIPWKPPPPYRRREIIQGEDEPFSKIRPMRVKAGRRPRSPSQRTSLAGPADVGSRSDHRIARGPRGQERTIHPNDPLTGLCRPPIVAAAIEGRLPRGFGVKRLTDLPMLWSQQWIALDLRAPAQV